MGFGKALFLDLKVILSGIIATSDQCGSKDELPGPHQVLPSYKMDRKTVEWYSGMRCRHGSLSVHKVGNMPNAGDSLSMKFSYCWLLLSCRFFYEACKRFQLIKATAALPCKYLV